MKNLSTYAVYVLSCLLFGSVCLYAAEDVRIRARLTQEQQSIPATHCTNTVVATPLKTSKESTSRICKLKKQFCENFQKHPQKRVYYCLRCDKECPRCMNVCKVSGCNSEGKKQEMCWNHGPRAISFCAECEKKCPSCHELSFEEEVEHLPVSTRVIESGECLSCSSYGMRLEQCEHGDFCGECECQQCPQECTICLDYERPRNDPNWVKFNGCDHPGSRFCNGCVIDICANHDSKCPFRCETPIDYAKCDSCKNYLAEDQPCITYECRGYCGISADTPEKHRCCVSCISATLKHTYLNAEGREVFRCPLQHTLNTWYYNDFEVLVDRVSFVETPKIESEHCADKAGVLQENACNLCHQEYKAEDDVIEHDCGQKRHKKRHSYHVGCLQTYVNNTAIKKEGRVGFFCPVSHGYEKMHPKPDVQFITLIENCFELKVPERFIEVCSLCSEDIDDVRVSDASSYDCFRSGRDTYYRTITLRQGYYVHPQCIARHIKNHGKEKQVLGKKGFLECSLFELLTLGYKYEKKIEYPCPFHWKTKQQHNVLWDPARVHALYKLLPSAASEEL